MEGKQVNSILVLIQASWSELDWILPVCRHIKNTQPDIEITILFTQNKMQDVIRGNKIMYDLLPHCANRCFDFNYFLPWPLRKLSAIEIPDHKDDIFTKGCRYIKHKSLKALYQHYNTRIASRIIALCKPDILLKDIAGDTDFRAKITSLAQASGSRVVAFPNGTEILSDKAWESQYNKLGCKADLILCSTDSAAEIYGNMYSRKTKAVGHPRYDNGWIRRLKEVYEQMGKKPVALTGKYVVALVTRGRHFQIISEETLNYLMREALEAVFSYPDTYLIVKPHPRQTGRDLEKYLKKYDRARWRIDPTALLCLGSEIDLTISPFSSVILDSLAVGVPVIEFFRFEGSNYNWNVDDKGNLETGYKKYGLVASASTGEELKTWIKKFREKPVATASPFLENFRRMFPQSENGATVGAVKSIMNKEGIK